MREFFYGKKYMAVEMLSQHQNVQRLEDLFPGQPRNGYANAFPLMPRERIEDILSTAKMSNIASYIIGDVRIQSEKTEAGEVLLFAKEQTDSPEKNTWIDNLLDDEETTEALRVSATTTIKQAATLVPIDQSILPPLTERCILEFEETIDSLKHHKDPIRYPFVKKRYMNGDYTRLLLFEEAYTQFNRMIHKINTMNEMLRIAGKTVPDSPDITDNTVRKRLGLSPLSQPISQ